MKKNLDIIYNKKYLVLVPSMSKELLDSFEYTFGNTFLMKNNYSDLDFFVDFINRNNFQQLILVDFQEEYDELLKRINGKHNIKFIYTKSLASLSDTIYYHNFQKIMNLHQKNKIDSIGFLDKNLYNIIKKTRKSIYHVILDINASKKEDLAKKQQDKTIGILNSQKDPKHSYYNELSAIKLVDGYSAKITKPNKVTKEFLRLFDIGYQITKEKNIYSNNSVNLYINFTNNIDTVFLQSMDQNVPCILGNTELLDDYKDLKKYLVVTSDDDINEISLKIKETIKNKNEILRLYKNFRTKYSIKSKESIEKFVGKKIDMQPEKKYEKLLSVIVPVYNTETYLEKSLKSILDARIGNMEILIINDGSKDNSEKIALKYQKKYPKIIRYIKQENHGLGNVRNVGLKEAKGKYIASVDSDDTINVNFFIDAMPYMENNIDMIIYDWLTVTDKETYPTSALDYVYNEKNKYEGLFFTTIMPSQCNKIIKKEIYDKLNINYIEDKYEDLSTNPIIMLATETIKYINKPYYEYYIRSNSIMRSNPGYSMIDVIRKLNERIEKYKDYCNMNLDETKFNTFYWRIEQYIINPLYDLDVKELEKIVDYINKNIKDIYFELLKSNLCKVMIENIQDKALQENIKKRNKMILEGNLKEFIIKYKKQQKKYQLTPPIIVYGK